MRGRRPLTTYYRALGPLRGPGPVGTYDYRQGLRPCTAFGGKGGSYAPSLPSRRRPNWAKRSFALAVNGHSKLAAGQKAAPLPLAANLQHFTSGGPRTGALTAVMAAGLRAEGKQASQQTERGRGKAQGALPPSQGLPESGKGQGRSPEPALFLISK